MAAVFLRVTAIVSYRMALEEPDSKTFAEILAEETGRDVSEFEPDDDLEIPDLEDLEEVDADEFYSES
jgi:hypothetical protein